MDNKEFGKNLERRTKKFAIAIIRLSCKLPNTAESNVVRTQITKSGTSVGANYREVNRSRSKPDFANKMKICESEASETIYWLEIIEEIGWLKAGVSELLKEANELLAIFTSSGHTLKTS